MTEGTLADHVLNDGTTLPTMGLGTAPMDDDASQAAVADAVQMGYRLIDTGAIYGNERGVGRGLRSGGVDRAMLRVMTKVRGRDQGYEATLAAFEESRRRLGLDFVDLYLIHWPNPSMDRYVETWRALVHLRDSGVVNSIGVSNFTRAQIGRLVTETGVTPAVDQVELHPQWPQLPLRDWLLETGVRPVAYSPLGRGGDVLTAPAVIEIAEHHEVTAAQVILRWHLQSGHVPLPRASGSRRRLENLEATRLRLSPEEVRVVSAALPHVRTGWDPETHEEL